MTTVSRRKELDNLEASPVVAWLHRFSAFALIFVAAGFTIWYRLDDRFMSTARGLIADWLQPVSTALYAPFVAAGELGETISMHFETVAQLDDLRTQLEEIPELQTRIIELESQLARAKLAANFPFREDLDFISANVISVSNDISRRVITIDAGARDGLRRDLPVANHLGLVGQVIEVGETTSRVMLITDFASSVPVLVEPLAASASATGNNVDQLLLKFLAREAEAELQIGDRILTSGQSQKFPAGLLVGEVSNLSDGVLEVTPNVKWHQLNHVRILLVPLLDSLNG